MVVPVSAAEVGGLAPAKPQPAADALQPGLSVLYYWHKFSDTREITEIAEYRKGTPGEPIAMLDYWVGDGEVLTSGRTDFVGAHITGFIHLSKQGTYTFTTHSNDGIDLKIGGKQIVKDSGIHSDRYSDLVNVKIAEQGLYPLDLLYFERQVTSTLELYWLQPGESGQLNHVPAEAFAHIAAEKPGG
ncbi:MAG: PA14 domain-containing protein [Alphaproteobacteria bacterium]